MPAHSGPVLALLALLALAGAQKIADPEATVGALKAAGLPGTRTVVMALGAFELSTGVAGIVIGGRILPFVASGLYAGFALFVINALVRKLPIRSCGCLGASETPPSVIHVVVNVAAAGTLLLAVMSPVDVISQMPSLGVGDGLAFLLFTGGVVYLLNGTLTVLPLHVQRSRAARRESPVHLSPGRR